jgi:VanZ family protein
MIDAFLWLLVVVMMFVVVYTSVTPPSGEPVGWDKVFHFVAYAGLTMSLLLAAVWAPVRGEGRFPTAPVAVFVGACVFGALIELIQAPIPGRDADIKDIVANSAGAIAALILWIFVRMAFESPDQSARNARGDL